MPVADCAWLGAPIVHKMEIRFFYNLIVRGAVKISWRCPCGAILAQNLPAMPCDLVWWYTRPPSSLSLLCLLFLFLRTLLEVLALNQCVVPFPRTSELNRDEAFDWSRVWSRRMWDCLVEGRM